MMKSSIGFTVVLPILKSVLLIRFILTLGVPGYLTSEKT